MQHFVSLRDITLQTKGAGANGVLAGQREGRLAHDARPQCIDQKTADATPVRTGFGLRIQNDDVGFGGFGDPGFRAVVAPAVTAAFGQRLDGTEVRIRTGFGQRCAAQPLAGHQVGGGVQLQPARRGG